MSLEWKRENPRLFFGHANRDLGRRHRRGGGRITDAVIGADSRARGRERRLPYGRTHVRHRGRRQRQERAHPDARGGATAVDGDPTEEEEGGGRRFDRLRTPGSVDHGRDGQGECPPRVRLRLDQVRVGD